MKFHIKNQVDELNKKMEKVMEVVTIIRKEHDIMVEREKGVTSTAAPFPVKDEIDGLKLRLMQCENVLHSTGSHALDRTLTGSKA